MIYQQNFHFLRNPSTVKFKRPIFFRPINWNNSYSFFSFDSGVESGGKSKRRERSLSRWRELLFPFDWDKFSGHGLFARGESSYARLHEILVESGTRGLCMLGLSFGPHDRSRYYSKWTSIADEWSFAKRVKNGEKNTHETSFGPDRLLLRGRATNFK